MKKLVLLFIAILLFQVAPIAQEGWVCQTQNTCGLFDVSFTDANIGTVVGNYGTILRTTNGGETWVPRESGTTESLNSISFIDANIGTIVCQSGTILKTTNGGETWISQNSGTSNPLYDVSFTDANNGTAIGYEGLMVRTTNGGETWFPQNSGTTNQLFSICFIDSNNGTIVGDFGTILRTTNGGETWIPQTSETETGLFGVSFADINNGIAVGLNGIILKTTDSGRTWHKQASGTTVWLHDILFMDTNNAITVGDGNTILRTTNSGETWIAQSIEAGGSINSLTSISFIDANVGSIVGYDRHDRSESYGIILRTTNGGVTFIEEKGQMEVASKFLLFQNYPNPFNPTTSIEYRVASTEYVTLKVYDMLGREVATLVNEIKHPGNYEVDFSAKGGSASGGNGYNLASGIYFYRIQSGNFAATKKMVLIK